MPTLSLKQHNELISQLAAEMKKCSAKFEEAKRLHENAVELREHFFPTEEDASKTGSITITPEIRRRFRTEDYTPHVTACLQERGSANYKEIHAYLVSAMNAPEMSVAQVNKFLNKAIADPSSPIERDPLVARGGNFRLKGHGSVPSVARPSDAAQAPNVSPSTSEMAVA